MKVYSPVSIPQAQPQYKTQLKASPGPGSPVMLQQSGFTPVKCEHLEAHGPASSRQDMILRAIYGPTWFQIHILDNLTFLTPQ